MTFTYRTVRPVARAPLALLLGLLPTATAPTLDERIGAAARPISWAADDAAATFTGPGAAFLLELAASSAFVALGGSHGNRETCAFATWLLRELRDDGFGALALETGPRTTAHLASIAADHGAAGVVDFVQREPFSVAFLFWEQDDRDVGKVFDLRALRAAVASPRLKAAERELHDLGFAFDLLVLLPRCHPSTALIPLPGGG